ncbi:phospholipase D-like domain-containing protein [Metaplanococcus flavidus]|uniref:Phospholipase D-like domain-containing protein n=1 Tax=Metaplanococcus flavidus TaxID=569883 RepID=A0ABW3LAT6_9BACL
MLLTPDFIEKSKEDIECILITCFDREDFINEVSSIAGVERLVYAGIKVNTLQDLHTWPYTFNKETITMDSANFTFKGFYKNHDFGVLMENEIIFAQEYSQYFEKLLLISLIQVTGGHFFYC